MDRLKREVWAATTTTVAAVASLAASLFLRDQLPFPRHACRLAGLIVLYLGMALFLWAAVHLKGAIGGLVTPRLDKVVATGPYQYVRHPTYVAILVALCGAALVTRSAIGLALAVLLFVPAAVQRARAEERALVAAFPDTWDRYASRTGPFVPKLGRPGAHAKDR